MVCELNPPPKNGGEGLGAALQPWVGCRDQAVEKRMEKFGESSHFPRGRAEPLGTPPVALPGSVAPGAVPAELHVQKLH